MKTAEELRQMFIQACEMQAIGKNEKALHLYQELTSFIHGFPDLHYNYGLAAFDLHRYELAEEQYAIASKANPDDADIHFNRGLNYRRLQKLHDAIVSFTAARNSGDNSTDTLYSLALCYQDLQMIEDASQLYKNILSVNPDHQPSLNNYAYLCHRASDLKKAEQLYSSLLLLNPAHDSAKHMLASLRGQTPEIEPLTYVEEVFDNYAPCFEKSLLEHLYYRTPTEIRKRFSCKFPGVTQSHCLDLGCGTGLAGAAFAGVYAKITGIDISEEILKIAAKKEIYEFLVKDDIIHFLTDDNNRYDLFLAADVFTYMGNLSEVFRLCFQRSMEGGLFCFSVENTDNEQYALKKTGRFGHSPNYITQAAGSAGWKICDRHPSRLRQEQGEWVNGTLFISKKT